MSNITDNILATIAYFDMFDYPLTSAEIYSFLPVKCDQYNFDVAVSCLVSSSSIYKFQSFYSLKNNYRLVVRRMEGNKKAAELIPIAKKISEVLIRFPYVRGIAISGSLSKNYADENSDIDLFVITAPNRLWIARTILHCLKKLTYLVNKQDYFCMNYFIDEEQLEIGEKNIYTAIETVTLIPLQGDQVIEQFYTANTWTQYFLPHKVMRLSSAKPLKPFIFKNAVETIFNNRMGRAIDNSLMKLTASRWSKKQLLKKMNNKGDVMILNVSKHCAKPDAGNLQSKLLNQYEQKISRLPQQPVSSIAN